jgi:hypothetical protein
LPWYSALRLGLEFGIKDGWHEQRSEAERAATVAAIERADVAEAAVEHEQRRSHFLEAAINLDTATILNLHHQVTIYAVGIAQLVENFLAGTQSQKMIPREAVLHAWSRWLS